MHQAVMVKINQTLPANKTNYRNDIASKNIYEKLNKDVHCNPNENYNILE